jgi:hypothetical protein
MPIVRMSDPIIVPLPVYYGTSDTRNGRPVFPKTGLFLCQNMYMKRNTSFLARLRLRRKELQSDYKKALALVSSGSVSRPRG